MTNIKNLINQLNIYTKAYDEGNPLISDDKYDELFYQLIQLEEESGIYYPDSPTQTINYEVVNCLNKIEHNHKMLSLAKTKEVPVVESFIGDKEFIAMCKMDGLTCSLTYKNGKLVSAETRGNGLVGEDILHNARIIPTIPQTIPYLDDLTIDGEIICRYSDFIEFQDSYKNPRNFAAGSIRLLDAKESASRKLTFVAWEVIDEMYNQDGTEKWLSEKLILLKDWGFTVVPFGKLNEEVNSIELLIALLKNSARNNSYPIDGLVFKFDDCGFGRSLGETEHHGRNAIAYKFYDELYETRLLDIEWTMGRTGQLTPVAAFEPVDAEGSTISKASLHNLTIMKETLGDTPYVGQKITIYKANEIIPQVADAVKDPPSYGTTLLIPPDHCPLCGEPTAITGENTSQFLFCTNENCEGKLINRIDHFASKKGLDIKGLSKATLEKLIDWEWVSKISDIFTLSAYRNEWVKKPGFGEKSVDNIIASIQEHSDCELYQFICSLGIPLIGITASKELAKQFADWEDFINAVESVYNFYEIPNFGTEMHNAIINFDYNEAKMIAEKYLFIQNSLNNFAMDNKLEGLTFTITGKLESFKNRDELKSVIESLGGKVTNSVSKNTNYLINNDINSASSKNETAKKLGVSIITERDFIETFGIA